MSLVKGLQVHTEEREAELRVTMDAMKPLAAGRFTLELGCGHGHYLTALADKERGEGMLYVGVDKNEVRIERAQKKSDRAGLNIKWVNAKVEDLVEGWRREGAGRVIERVFILFPDPWPKTRHHKNRFVNAELIAKLAEIMPKGARLYFRTDHPGYFAEGKKVVEGNKSWAMAGSELWPTGLPQTVFEGHHPVYQELVAVRG